MLLFTPLFFSLWGFLKMNNLQVTLGFKCFNTKIVYLDDLGVPPF